MSVWKENSTGLAVLDLLGMLTKKGVPFKSTMSVCLHINQRTVNEEILHGGVSLNCVQTSQVWSDSDINSGNLTTRLTSMNFYLTFINNRGKIFWTKVIEKNSLLSNYSELRPP
jgi:hypothetical protein